MFLFVGCQSVVIVFDYDQFEAPYEDDLKDKIVKEASYIVKPLIPAALEEELVLDQKFGSLGFGIVEYSDALTINCGPELRELVLERNIIDTVLHFLIGGLYTRRDIRVYCGRDTAIQDGFWD